MYKRSGSGVLKHLDFLVLDLFVVELSYLLGYHLRFYSGGSRPLSPLLYLLMAGILGLLLVFFNVFFNTYEGILHRGWLKELRSVLFEAVEIFLMVAAYLFLSKGAENYSRLAFLYTGGFFVVLDYAARQFLKRLVCRQMRKNPERSMLLYTTEAMAESVVASICRKTVRDFQVSGLILHDGQVPAGEKRMIAGVPVVASKESAVSYICTRWVDEIFVDMPDGVNISSELVDEFIRMGVAVHQTLPGGANMGSRNLFTETVCGRTVITGVVNSMTATQAFGKRLMDVLGGLVGSCCTLLLTLLVGPVIFIKSPGPIFFKQTRVGKNGKTFTIYKFRSMYMDAEARKQELMAQNKMEGLLFKVDDDPRIIKGIGSFIRKHSIDEFPQFFNVLRGDMSLVGTRPPTLDEWNQYEPHHRLRMAAKPGLTGLWQVSGRSDIVDFEEVVALDEKYIRSWDLAADIRIIFKTIGVVFTGKGAE